jgi:hypothetical protein
MLAQVPAEIKNGSPRFSRNCAIASKIWGRGFGLVAISEL